MRVLKAGVVSLRQPYKISLLNVYDIMFYQVAIADLDVASYDADILIFVLPYQFVRDVCIKLQGKVKPTALAVSLIKVCNLMLLIVCVILCDSTHFRRW